MQIAGGPWHNCDSDAGPYQAHNRVNLRCVLSDLWGEAGLLTHGCNA
jgi:hypothetical protein